MSKQGNRSDKRLAAEVESSEATGKCKLPSGCDPAKLIRHADETAPFHVVENPTPVTVSPTQAADCPTRQPGDPFIEHGYGELPENVWFTRGPR